MKGMICILKQFQRGSWAELLAERLKKVHARQLIARALQEQHGNLHAEKMFRTVRRRLAGRMQRKSKEDQSAHSRQWRQRLRLRSHSPTERFTACEQGNVRQQSSGLP